jgi:hypothetical protein
MSLKVTPRKVLDAPATRQNRCRSMQAGRAICAGCVGPGTV